MKAPYKENMAKGPHRTDFNPMTSNTKSPRNYGKGENAGGAPSGGGPSGKFVGDSKTSKTYGVNGV